LSGLIRELINHSFEHRPCRKTTLVTFIIHAGYRSATLNVLGGKVELLLQTTSLVYQAIYEIKMVFLYDYE